MAVGSGLSAVTGNSRHRNISLDSGLEILLGANATFLSRQKGCAKERSPSPSALKRPASRPSLAARIAPKVTPWQLVPAYRPSPRIPATATSLGLES